MISAPDFLKEKKPLRDGANWNDINAVLSDKTRSGKQKRRLSHSNSKRVFNVKFNLTFEEYLTFRNWYRYACYYGLVSFAYPKIDSLDNEEEVEYRFNAGAEPQYTNPTGQIVQVSMVWEEV